MDEATLNMIKAINEKRQAEGKSELIITGKMARLGKIAMIKARINQALKVAALM